MVNTKTSEVMDGEKTFLQVTKEHNLTEQETVDLAYFFAIVKAKKKNISPTQLLTVINNYSKLQAIFLKS